MIDLSKLAAIFTLLVTLLLSGCESTRRSREPAIHGDVGVRVQSRDTAHIVPTR